MTVTTTICDILYLGECVGDISLSDHPLSHPPCYRTILDEHIEGYGCGEYYYQGNNQREVPPYLSSTMIMSSTPLVLGRVHGVQNVKTNSVQVGKLVT